MKRFHLCVVPLLFLMALPACSDSDDSESASPAQRVEELNTALFAYTQAASDVFKGYHEAFGKLLDNYSLTVADLQTQDVPEEDLDAFALALANTTMKHRHLMIKAHRMVKAAAAAGASQKTSALRSPLGQKQQPIICGGLCVLVGGAAIGGAMTYFGLKEIHDTAANNTTEPLDEVLTDSTKETRGVIVDTMKRSGIDIADDASADEIKSEMDKLSNHQKIQLYLDTDSDLNSAANEDGNVQTISYEAKKKATLKTVSEVGQGAVKRVVGDSMAVTGSMVSELIQGVGGSELLATMVDVGLSVAGKQPMDVFADKLEVHVVDKDTAPVTVPPPPAKDDPVTTVEEAEEVLQLHATPGDQVDQAMSVLANEILETAGAEELGGQTNSDGSVTVQAPEQVYIARVEEPTGELTFPAFNFGPADVLITADDAMPEVQEDLTLTDGFSLEFAGEPITGGGVTPTPNPSDGALYINHKDADDAGYKIDNDIIISIATGAQTVAWPATLEGPSPSNALVSWASPINESPFEVIFNASKGGTYSLNFTLTDADGAVFRGVTSITIEKESDDPWQLCVDTYNAFAYDSCTTDEDCGEGNRLCCQAGSMGGCHQREFFCSTGGTCISGGGDMPNATCDSATGVCME